MEKRNLGILSLTIGALLSPLIVHADLIGPSPIVVGGVLLVGVGIVVGVIALIAWLIIRAIKKKNAPNSTQTVASTTEKKK